MEVIWGWDSAAPGAPQGWSPSFLATADEPERPLPSPPFLGPSNPGPHHHSEWALSTLPPLSDYPTTLLLRAWQVGGNDKRDGRPSRPWQGGCLAHQRHIMKTYCSENIVNSANSSVFNALTEEQVGFRRGGQLPSGQRRPSSPQGQEASPSCRLLRPAPAGPPGPLPKC